MPPSFSDPAATRADDDDEDHAPPPETLISDSDIADYDEPEEEIEEFEEIEVDDDDDDDDGEEGEEEIEFQEEESEGDDQDRNDGSKDMESKGHDEHLGSGSSTPEKSKVRLPFNAPAVGESTGDFNSSGPSNEPLKTHKEESYVSYEDFRYPKSGKPLAFAEDNESREPVVYKNDAGVLPEMKIPKSHTELLTGIKAHLCNNEIVDAETANPFSGTGKEVAVSIPMRDHFGEGPEGANIVLGSEEETKRIDMQSGNDKKRMASRLASPEIRARSLSPGAEIKDGNKRPAVICDFYAKGWCIKGSSCRFLHIKDNVDNISQQPERDIAAANGKGEVKFDEGLRNVIERSRLPGFPDLLTSSVGNNTASSSHFSSESILPLEHGESPRLHQFQENHKFPLLQREDKRLGIPSDFQQLPSSKDDLGFNSSFKDVGRESLRRNRPADHYNDCASLINKGSSPLLGNILLPEYRSSSGSVIALNNYDSVNPSSYGSSLGDLTCIRSQYMPNDHSLPVLSHSLNSSLSTLPGNFPSHRISAWKGSSFSSSLNACPLGAKKLFNSDRDYRTSRSSSLLRSSSPFSGSEPENLHLTNVSGDPTLTADYKISSNDWEPSVPFRPSFFITPTSISSPGSQYDPLRDSIDLPNTVDRSFKFSFSSPGASILSTSHQRIYGDSILTGTAVPKCNDEKNSVSSPIRFHQSVLDRNCYTPGKDSLISGAETVGTSVVDGQNGTTPKEENPSVTFHGKDVPKTNKIDINHDSRHQSKASRHKKDSKLDKVRQNNEMEVEFITDGEVQQESKAVRHFRAALVDLVKELLKPTWREGNLSKDAHNTIVKKAVDKVLSTLQSHQIFTMESIKQYLSSSRPKITKLVEAYVDKYGKS